jgi:hypothetical protein
LACAGEYDAVYPIAQRRRRQVGRLCSDDPRVPHVTGRACAPNARFVSGVDFEIERDAAAVARDLHRCFDQLLADAVTATRRLHVHLVEPRGRAAVLQRPQE